MTDDTANLVLEHLKRFQAQMTRFEDRLDAMGSDLRAVKRHLAVFMASEAAQDGGIAAIKLQLERIEHRLEVRDQ